MDNKRLAYLLDRYYQNALTNIEQLELDQWYSSFDQKQDDLHLIYFQKHSDKIANKIYRAILDRINSTAYRKPVWGYAAVIVLLLCVSISLFLNRFTIYDRIRVHTTTTVTAPAGKIRIVDLPDDSRVWLRAGSQITYNRFFLGSERSLELSGEAYFEVEKNPDKPFVVSSSGYEVRVLGTSFNIKALNEFQVYEVMVRTGKVQVSDSGHTVASLSADAGLAIHGSQWEYIDHVVSGNYLNWREGGLFFSNSSMQEIKWYLENQFNVQIVLEKDAFHYCHFSGDFSGLNLSQILELLQEVHPFEVRYDGLDRLILTSENPCVP